MQITKTIILIPVYNDWNALCLLINKIQKDLKSNVLSSLSFVIVNDCSDIENSEIINFILKESFSTPIKIIHLTKNIGHQKAIAIGLSYIAENLISDKVIIMDSDGEDKPEHLNALLKTSNKNKGKIVFARRTKRMESIIFRISYLIYKMIFKALTNKTINFGNFSIIPFKTLKKVVNIPEIWVHYSGGIICSKLPYTSIPLERGKRLIGKPKMNFTSLVIHGLSSIAVHIEIVVVRLLIVALTLFSLSILSIITIFCIKFFTPYAIPGWATSSVLELSNILIQIFFMSLLFVFFILNRKSQHSFIPIIEHKNFIMSVDKIDAQK